MAYYEVTVRASDDETYEYSLEEKMEDGSPFPWEDYEIEYSVTYKGGNMLTLTEADGVIIHSGEGIVTFSAPSGSLAVGKYKHGCRIRHLDTAKEIQVFTGNVTIYEGEF